MTVLLRRRHFVMTLLASLLAPAGARAFAAGRPAADAVVVCIDDSLPGAESLRLGSRLGAEEAGHTAALLRRELEFRDVRPDEAASAMRAADARVVVAGIAAPALVELTRGAAAAGAIVLNAGNDDDALRGDACAPALFHVMASRRMRQDVLAAWRAHARTTADATAVEWHAGLSRFGAEQLNDRCIDRFGVPMDDGVWLGWMAAKIAAESIFRARDGDAAALRTYLRTDRTRFDGHKGRPLSFRAWDQQLRQPLYVVRDGAVVAELPDTRVAALPQELDDYGARASETSCPLPDDAGAATLLSSALPAAGTAP